MMQTKKSSFTEEVDDLIIKHGRDRSSLMPILQEIQCKYGYISDFFQQEVAHQLDIHPVEVYGVTTFYSFLNAESRGRFIVRLCQTVSCDLAGKDAIARTIERELGVKFGETTADKKFSLEYINCMGMCDQGPAMLINDKVYTKLTPHSVVDILNNCK